MTGIFYHNPRCSKSREALKLLQENGVEPQIIEYLKTPPDADTLDAILKELGLEPRELMRRKEPPFKELSLADPDLSREALIAAMVEHPVLIERPIYRNKGKSRLGRPPEQVLEIAS